MLQMQTSLQSCVPRGVEEYAASAHFFMKGNQSKNYMTNVSWWLNYKNQMAGFVEDTLTAPAVNSDITSSLSATSPPAMTGVVESLQIFETTFGMSAGRISIKSGLAFFNCLSMFS